MTRVLVGLALIGALASGIAAEEPASILRPSLDGFEPAVADLLRSRMERLESLAASGPSTDELARELGELGRLFLVYNLPESAESCLARAEQLQPDEFSWRYLRGSILQQRGDLEQARAVLTGALGLEPTDPTVQLRLAQIEFELGDEERAGELYRPLAERPGFGAAAHYGLGRIAAARGDLSGAVEHFETALSEQPQASQVRYQLGLAHRGLGDLERARELLAARGAGQLKFPDPEMETLGAGAVGVEVYLADGRRLRNRGDLPGAVAAFQRAIAAEPDEPEHWAILGATLLQMGRVEDSVRAYREVERLDPTSPSMLYNLAIGLIRLGQIGEAVARLEALVAQAPDHVDGRVNLATLYDRGGRPGDAERLLTEAIELDPYDSELQAQRASVLISLGRAPEARREMVALLRAEPDNAEALLVLGMANEALGSPGDAVAAWERVLALGVSEETAATAHYYLGRSLLGQGRSEEAVARLQRAVDSLPANRQLRLTLAGALGSRGEYRRAVEQYDAAIASEPRDESARFGKAMSLLLSGGESAASAHLSESVELLPESVPLKHLLARLLATAADDTVRDGAEALRLAREVFERAQTIDHAETVAMAFAELGRFDHAADWQGQIVERARATGQGARVPALEARRIGYQRGEVVRAPWSD